MQYFISDTETAKIFNYSPVYSYLAAHRKFSKKPYHKWGIDLVEGQALLRISELRRELKAYNMTPYKIRCQLKHMEELGIIKIETVPVKIPYAWAVRTATLISFLPKTEFYSKPFEAQAVNEDCFSPSIYNNKYLKEKSNKREISSPTVKKKAKPETVKDTPRVKTGEYQMFKKTYIPPATSTGIPLSQLPYPPTEKEITVRLYYDYRDRELFHQLSVLASEIVDLGKYLGAELNVMTAKNYKSKTGIDAPALIKTGPIKRITRLYRNEVLTIAEVA